MTGFYLPRSFSPLSVCVFLSVYKWTGLVAFGYASIKVHEKMKKKIRKENKNQKMRKSRKQNRECSDCTDRYSKYSTYLKWEKDVEIEFWLLTSDLWRPNSELTSYIWSLRSHLRPFTFVLCTLNLDLWCLRSKTCKTSSIRHLASKLILSPLNHNLWDMASHIWPLILCNFVFNA